MPNFENAPKWVVGRMQNVIHHLSHYSLFFCQLQLLPWEHYCKWEIQQQKTTSAQALPFSFTLKDNNFN